MIENIIALPLIHIFSILGFGLALAFVIYLFKSNKSPSSTIAWLLVVFLIPYLGVPLYILFGGRKIRKMYEAKEKLWPHAKPVEDVGASMLPGRISVVFGIHEDPCLQAFMTGEEAFKELCNLIKEAKDHICISTFILGDDPTGRAVVDLLTEKLSEGVHIYLLLDAIGCSPLFHSPPDLNRFKTSGGRVAFFMPMMRMPFRGRANLRNHRKIVLADQRIAMMGGMNIADEYMGPMKDLNRWRDLSVTVHGGAVADLYQVFRSDWEFASKSKLNFDVQNDRTPRLMMKDTCDANACLQLVPSGPDVEGDPLHESIISMFFKAEDSITIITPYFVPDEFLMKALCIVLRKGVQVKLLIPDKSNHRFADLARGYFVRELEKNGAMIHRYRSGMIHAKLILIDKTLSIVGSANMDLRSLFLNYEIALFIHSAERTGEFEDWTRRMIEASETGSGKTGPVKEFVEGVARLFSPLL